MPVLKVDLTSLSCLLLSCLLQCLPALAAGWNRDLSLAVPAALSALWGEVCLGGDLEEPVGSRRLFLLGLELLPSTELSVGPWRCLTHLVLAALVRHSCLSSCNGFCLAS